jgi:hypothetical protein
MVKVTTIGLLVVFTNVPLMLPLPLFAIPVTLTVLSLDQLNVDPGVVPVRTIVAIAAPEHLICVGFVALTIGVGLTVTVAVIGVPSHPLAVGVMVKVTKTGKAVVFVNIPLMVPLPLEAIPVTLTVLFLVQLKTVPATLPEKVMAVRGFPEQFACEAIEATASGIGFTVMVTVSVYVKAQVTAYTLYVVVEPGVTLNTRFPPFPETGEPISVTPSLN